MKKAIVLLLALFLIFAINACSSSGKVEDDSVELVVFAAASLTATMNEIVEMYKKVAPNVNIILTLDSSGTLKTQIENGADCDVFISAAQKQMNQLDIKSNIGNEGLDYVISDTRFNLVENTVVLVTNTNSVTDINSFEDVITDKVNLIALGNSDVPAGQYAKEVFTSMGLWNQLNNEGKITFGSNVREISTWVKEGVADCGVVYCTDVYSTEGLKIITEAPEGTIATPVVYPAAVLNISNNTEEAKAFLEFLKTDECSTVFEDVGFTIPK